MHRSWGYVVTVALLATACRDAVEPQPSAAVGAATGNVPPVAAAGGPYFTNGDVQFDGRGSSDPDGHLPLTYVWEFGDGTTGTGAAPLHRYAADGVYVARLTVSDALGASSAPAPALVTIAAHLEPATVLLSGASNIARCASPNDEATARLLDESTGLVVALGDNALPDGGLAAYQACYGPSWGRHKDRTYAVLGNHDYELGNADGAFDYFGARIGPRGKGYYSFDVGAWHIVVLNDNGSHVPYAAGSEQDAWLVNDLAASDKPCTIAMWHTPRFLSSTIAGWTDNPSRKTLWTRLHAAGADIVLNGQEHNYERMAPMTPDGARDDAAGIRQFNAGMGGESPGTMPTVIHPNSEVRGVAYGVLSLTLRPRGYDWEFRSVDGSFSDSGSGACH